MKKSIYLLSIAAIFCIAATSVMAQSREDYVGVYRSGTADSNLPGVDRIVRVLRLNSDGSATLASRYRDQRPPVNRDTLRRHGTLLTEIAQRRKIIHSGSWRMMGRNATVTLTSMDYGRRVNATFVVNLRTGRDVRLNVISYDRAMYGQEGFQFVRIRDEEDVDDVPSPVEDLNFSVRGSGYLTVRGDRDEIERIAAVTGSGGIVEITVELRNGRDRRFVGRVIESTRQRTVVQLRSSGSVNASGTLTFDEGGRDRVQWIYGNGTLDGRNFTLDFTRGAGDRPGGGSNAHLNLFQRGDGTFRLTGRPEQRIESVSVESRSGDAVEIRINYRGGGWLLMEGDIDRRDRDTLRVRLRKSAQALMTGDLTIDYDRNTINRISGEGQLDGRRFTLRFSR